MTDLELPGMEELERIPPPPRPRYRAMLWVQVEYEEYVEFQTDEDPEYYLEDDGIIGGMAVEVMGWSNPIWSPDTRAQFIEVTYDDGKSWERYESK